MLDDTLDHYGRRTSMPGIPSIATAVAYPSQVPRLGQISFVNSLPVLLPIDRGYLELGATVIYGSPAELNYGYANGSLDLGAMSSSFFITKSDLELMPGLSISSTGPVGSVLFFSKVSPHKLGGAKVSVPSSSTTSVNLLKLLLAEQLGVTIECIVDPEPDINNPQIEGALVIGDRALQVDAAWSNKYWRADLGQWWISQSGLPMVFAVWAARASWAKTNVSEFQNIGQTLVASTKLGLSTLFPQVVAEALTRTSLQPHRLQRYFQQQIDYRLTQKHWEGLELFKTLSKHHGLIA